MHREIIIEKQTSTVTEKKDKCFDCQMMFKSKSEMMIHGLDVHINKGKMCRDPENCTFTKCWFRHNHLATQIISHNVTTNPKIVVTKKESNSQNINDQDFLKAPTNLKPKLNRQN